MFDNLTTHLLFLDPLACVMIALVSYIGSCVGGYSFRYMKGDHKYITFFTLFILVVTSTIIMVSADHILLFFCAWCASNLLLTKLMGYKPNWQAARASASLAAKNHLITAVCIGSGLLYFYFGSQSTSIQTIVHSKMHSSYLLPGLALLIVGAAAQSAVYPFHKWLMSSLNSPTPVSALMHAGLINAGGYLLARFAPLYIQLPEVLDVIFVVGIASAFLGTAWKLIQSDIKRSLACSTMGQMGFMLAQCGLGLFAAAVTHVVWHGLFKAYLFLSSSSAAQERRYSPKQPPTALTFACALFCGALASYGMALGSGKPLLNLDTSLMLFVIALLAGTQTALPLLARRPIGSLLRAVSITGSISYLYGLSIQLISGVLLPMNITHPQPLNLWHMVAIAMLVVGWLWMVFTKTTLSSDTPPKWFLKIYAAALDASQPHPSTVTTHRNSYTYK